MKLLSVILLLVVSVPALAEKNMRTCSLLTEDEVSSAVGVKVASRAHSLAPTRSSPGCASATPPT